MGTIEPYTLYQMPLNKDIVFVDDAENTAGCLQQISSPMWKCCNAYNIPNGECGFYFVTLRYVDNVAEIFARSRLAPRAQASGSGTVVPERKRGILTIGYWQHRTGF
jgi:hypothetical protein